MIVAAKALYPMSLNCILCVSCSDAISMLLSLMLCFIPSSRLFSPFMFVDVFLTLFLCCLFVPEGFRHPLIYFLSFFLPFFSVFLSRVIWVWLSCSIMSHHLPLLSAICSIFFGSFAVFGCVPHLFFFLDCLRVYVISLGFSLLSDFLFCVIASLFFCSSRLVMLLSLLLITSLSRLVFPSV